MKSILDPKFVYVNSLHTNIKKTFERIRKEQEQEAKILNFRKGVRCNTASKQDSK